MESLHLLVGQGPTLIVLAVGLLVVWMRRARHPALSRRLLGLLTPLAALRIGGSLFWTSLDGGWWSARMPLLNSIAIAQHLVELGLLVALAGVAVQDRREAP